MKRESNSSQTNNINQLNNINMNGKIKIFNEQDIKNIDLLNNEYINQLNITDQNKTLELLKPNNNTLLTNLINKRISKQSNKVLFISPTAFEYSVNIYINYIKTRKVTIQEARGTIRGNALERQIIYPPTIEDFCTNINISKQTLNKLVKLDEYKQAYELLVTEINAVLLSLTMIGQIVGKETVKMYLVNNSEYQDVSVVNHNNNEKKLPPFMTSKPADIEVISITED